MCPTPTPSSGTFPRYAGTAVFPPGPGPSSLFPLCLSEGLHLAGRPGLENAGPQIAGGSLCPGATVFLPDMMGHFQKAQAYVSV